MTSGARKHEYWGSRFGYLMAAIGGAVGLGNIWRFPYLLGENGGGAFMIVYLGAVLLIALPLMLAEMMIGRRTGLSAPSALRQLAGEFKAPKAWGVLGWLGLSAIFMTLSFFSVVGGWSLEYALKSASGAFAGQGADDAAAQFGAFQNQPVKMAAWHFGFMAVTVFIVARGIRSGIEASTKLLMPLLLLAMAAFVVYGATLGAFGEAMHFLFAVDFSKITPAIVIAAVGQAFFSANVGLGAVLTYAAYLPKDANLPNMGATVVAGDTIIALVAGAAIFPIVFAVGLDPASGPPLLFISMSAAFGQMAGGGMIGAAFFLLIFVAAVTTSISMLETIVSRAEERAGVKRPIAAIAIGGAAFLLGIGTVLSFGAWSEVYLPALIGLSAPLTIFGTINFVVTSVIFPIGGIGFAIFAGWIAPRLIARDELGFRSAWLFDLWLFSCRYLIPLAVIAMLAAPFLAGGSGGDH